MSWLADAVVAYLTESHSVQAWQFLLAVGVATLLMLGLLLLLVPDGPGPEPRGPARWIARGRR
jgi:hypothetical protein